MIQKILYFLCCFFCLVAYPLEAGCSKITLTNTEQFNQKSIFENELFYKLKSAYESVLMFI